MPLNGMYLCTPSKCQFNIMVAPSVQRGVGRVVGCQGVSGVFSNIRFCIKTLHH